MTPWSLVAVSGRPVTVQEARADIPANPEVMIPAWQAVLILGVITLFVVAALRSGPPDKEGFRPGPTR